MHSFTKKDFDKYLKDDRPLDEWGLPIGKAYSDKQWNELKVEEMKADFRFKNDILRALAEEVSPATFYEYLYADLLNEKVDSNFKLMVIDYNGKEKSKILKLDLPEVLDLKREGVAISPCLYWDNWKKKDLLYYVGAFVLDIDELRPLQLQRFFKLFEEKRILTPSFIVNSGRGVHFYYMLDHFIKVDCKLHSTNYYLAEKIYFSLYDDVKKKENYKKAERHWIGQDYRVVGSLSKINEITTAWRVGPIYTFDELIKYFNLKDDRKKNISSPRQQAYAKSIAKDLNLELPPEILENANELYNFIADNKDAAYQVREKRRQNQSKKLKKKKKGTWYRRTVWYLKNDIQSGYRFSSLKALAIIAFKERSKISRDEFLKDLDDIVSVWEHKDWGEDSFNTKNVEAIIRLYDNAIKYQNTSSGTLEEWLGTKFSRIGNKTNGRTQAEHIKIMNAIRDIEYENGSWRNTEGQPKKNHIVQKWREENPDGTKYQCAKDTGLSKNTIKKWWDSPASED